MKGSGTAPQSRIVLLKWPYIGERNLHFKPVRNSKQEASECSGFMLGLLFLGAGGGGWAPVQEVIGVLLLREL